MNVTHSVRAARHLFVIAAFALSTSGCLTGSGGSATAPDAGGGNAPGNDNNAALTVTITDPDAAQVDTADDNISLEGTAEGDSAISTVTWKNDVGGEGTANGTSNWQAGDIPLAVGSNTITLTAVDAEGDSGSDTIVVNRESTDPEPVTLSWEAPTQREDGSPLTDLAGYRLYYGRLSEVYDYEIDISNPGLQTFVVEDLASGEWYFAITAYDSEGLESEFSNEATEQVM